MKISNRINENIRNGMNNKLEMTTSTGDASVHEVTGVVGGRRV